MKKYNKVVSSILISAFLLGIFVNSYSKTINSNSPQKSDSVIFSSLESLNLSPKTLKPQERIISFKTLSAFVVSKKDLSLSKKTNSELLPVEFLPLIKEKTYLSAEFATST